MLSFSLFGGPQAAHAARDRVTGSNGMVPESVAPTLLLLLTELITNAVKFGGPGGSIAVTIAVDSNGLTATVTDGGAGFDWMGRDPDRPPGDGGFGLLLVERMARRWGIDRGEGSTTVWFELA